MSRWDKSKNSVDPEKQGETKEQFGHRALTSLGYVFDKDGTVTLNGAPVKTTNFHKGYKYLCKIINGKQYKFAIHRIIAFAYCSGYSPELDVNHKDGNPQNNDFNNLEWVTRSVNIKHAFASGLSKISEAQKNRFIEMAKSKTRGKSANAKKVIDIESQTIYECISDAAESLGMKRSTLAMMLTGKNPNKTNLRYYGQI